MPFELLALSNRSFDHAVFAIIIPCIIMLYLLQACMKRDCMRWIINDSSFVLRKSKQLCLKSMLPRRRQHQLLKDGILGRRRIDGAGTALAVAEATSAAGAAAAAAQVA